MRLTYAGAGEADFVIDSRQVMRELRRVAESVVGLQTKTNLHVDDWKGYTCPP
jgi:hypothetical protein